MIETRRNRHASNFAKAKTEFSWRRAFHAVVARPEISNQDGICFFYLKDTPT